MFDLKNENGHAESVRKAAESITGLRYQDKDSRVKTAFGRKTCEGVADIIQTEIDKELEGGE